MGKYVNCCHIALNEVFYVPIKNGGYYCNVFSYLSEFCKIV